MRKQVTVTEGAGSLSSYPCERLLQDGYDVLCIDNFYTGVKENLRNLFSDPHVESIRHDITFPIYVEVDEICNLARPASPIHRRLDQVQATKTRFHGSIEMLDLGKRTKAEILQPSTSEVYGDPEVHPQYGDYSGRVNSIGPRSCYDEGKRRAGTLFFRLSTPARRTHQGCPHLQYLWSADASR
jgi:UDP-glucuronate decarboxylase